MTHEEKKVTKIVEELSLYFFAAGADHIQSEIKRIEDDFTILFRANFSPDRLHDVERLEKYLNGEKNDGMEDIYWGLAGSGDPGEASQLLLVGMMIDHAKIQLEGDEVVLHLTKKIND
ncbi:MAG: hypothetical protein LBM69_02545 [Lachnospiraceae bacterium]|jgi:hypothetical protein|nr:hypothetical protein [Lachnospiraceae bacterium]